MEIIIGIVVILVIVLMIKMKSFSPNYKYKNSIVKGLKEASLIQKARNIDAVLCKDNELSKEIWLSIDESRNENLSVEEAYQKIDSILLKNGM